MKILDNLRLAGKDVLGDKLDDQRILNRQVDTLVDLMANIFGPDKLVLKAGKLGALTEMKSDSIEQRVLGLEKILFEDPTLREVPQVEDIPSILDRLEEQLADIIARRSVEEKIERKISKKMQERHEEYVREIKLQVMKEEAGPENPQTLKKYSLLQKMEQRKLSGSALDVLKPRRLKEIVGQDAAIRALLSKIATPYPQHVLLYGPPGVGKTTAARLALAAANKMGFSPFVNNAPFVEVNGATLRWDPREATNPLIGSVHDPIYQGARRDLADSGIPEPKMGLVSEAHGGVLFIDEIAEMDPLLQTKLLKVLEDKRVEFDSSYYDPSDPNIPKYIKKLFEDGAPADFILIGATTREPEDINPALRSRCAEIFFEPLTPLDIQRICSNAAKRLKVKLAKGVPELISEYTMEGRQAVRILADAYGFALTSNGGRPSETLKIDMEMVLNVIQTSRLVPNVTIRLPAKPQVGKTYGLGVYGYVGSVLEIEALAFSCPEKGKGVLRFNETAGSMAKDSAFNAMSVVRKLTGENVFDHDVHINVVGGGRIDGPSAGLAMVVAITSAILGRAVNQDTAITGEVSIQGEVRMVGGIPEKLFGARQAGFKKVILPRENEKDIPKGLTGIEINLVDTVQEALGYMLIDGFGDQLRRVTGA